MKRGSFALSWGRKIFFGLSWPLSLALSLIYLKSFNLPQSGSEALYYVLNLVGVTGLLNAILYFVFFCPIALLMPTYYICRMWSLILVLLLNISILADALLYANYRQHLTSFITKLAINEGYGFIPYFKNLSIGAGVFFFIFAVFAWIRGERIWRYMKSRFTNPVSNWYLYFIILFLAVAQTLYFKSEVNPQLANLFPAEPMLKKSMIEGKGSAGRFNYPGQKISCTAKKNPNLIYITLKNWPLDSLTEETMPNVFHMKEHGSFFENHYSASANAAHSIFTLYYSIPASYYEYSQYLLPAILTELKNRQYEIVDPTGNTDEASLSKALEWAENKSDNQPFYLNVLFNDAGQFADEKIASLILKLQLSGLLENTFVVITGGSSGNNLDLRVPLLLVTPDKDMSTFSHVTTHYDVTPTLMSKLWSCKNDFLMSFSNNLEGKDREWMMVSDADGLKVWDFKNSVLTTVRNNQVTDESLNGGKILPRRSLVLEALKIDQKYFAKP